MAKQYRDLYNGKVGRIIAVTAAGLLTVGVAASAATAASNNEPTRPTAPAGQVEKNSTSLTADAAGDAIAAALKEYPDATVKAVSTGREEGYVVMLKTQDGERLAATLDSDFSVTGVLERPERLGRGLGGHGGPGSHGPKTGERNSEDVERGPRGPLGEREETMTPPAPENAPAPPEENSEQVTPEENN